MKSSRENPDSEENQRATRDNANYIGGLQLAATHKTNYPDEIWADSDLVCDDEPHENWPKYIRADLVPDAKACAEELVNCLAAVDKLTAENKALNFVAAAANDFGNKECHFRHNGMGKPCGKCLSCALANLAAVRKEGN